MRASVVEGETGAGNEVFDGAGDEYLAWLGCSGYPGPDRDCDAGHFAIRDLALACVQASTNLDPKLTYGRCDRLCALDRARGAVEAGEESVAGGVHLGATEAGELPADRAVVLVEEVAPAAVAELRHLLRGADDVREQHGG